MKYSDSQLLNRVKNLDGFTGFSGIIDIWVRSSADKFNRFDDKVYTYDCTGDKPKFITVCSGTTNAGSYGLKHFEEYNRLGCAILKSDCIVYQSHHYGLHKGKYPAYVQARSFPYFRDGNKNEKVEEIGPEYHDVIGANCHRAGIASTFIDNWSVACLVRNIRAEYDHWLKFMDKRPLTVAILREF